MGACENRFDSSNWAIDIHGESAGREINAPLTEHLPSLPLRFQALPAVCARLEMTEALGPLLAGEFTGDEADKLCVMQAHNAPVVLTDQRA